MVWLILHWLDWSNTSPPVCCSIGVIVNKHILQWSIDVNNNSIMNESLGFNFCFLTSNIVTSYVILDIGIRFLIFDYINIGYWHQVRILYRHSPTGNLFVFKIVAIHIYLSSVLQYLFAIYCYTSLVLANTESPTQFFNISLQYTIILLWFLQTLSHH